MSGELSLFDEPEEPYDAVKARKIGKGKRPPAPNRPSLPEERENSEATGRRPRFVPGPSGQQAVAAMYVAPNLASVIVIAPVTGLPAEVSDPVFPGAPEAAGGKPYVHMSPAEYRSILAQLEALDWARLSVDKRRELWARWCVIDDWAAAEGWTWVSVDGHG